MAAATIDELLSKGDIGGGRRSRARAGLYLADFRSALGLPKDHDSVLEPLLEDFLIEAVLGAAWYEKRYHGAQQKVWGYIALNVVLIVSLPVALIGLGALAGPGLAKGLIAQVTGVLTGVLALQKTLSSWYATQQRYAAWYKSASDLKSNYYGLVQAWQGKALGPAFVPALQAATAAARQVIETEHLDYYQKLTLPSFDILDMLTGSRAAVETFVTGLLPGGPPTTIAVAGKNLIASTQASVTPATGAGSGAATDSPQLKVLAAGAAKANPYTIVLLANPAIESPVESGNFLRDPILDAPAQFAACAQYVINSVFGKLPGQAETFMLPFEAAIRIVALFDPTVPTDATSALVGAYLPSDIIGPRQPQFAAFLARYQLNGQPLTADVAFAITAAGQEKRSAAQFTQDDDTAAGAPFQIDGAPFFHRYRNLQPGAVALHVSATSVVALHEFGHAASSWTNGCVKDLYMEEDLTDGPVNIRVGRPIPANFATLDAKTYASDMTRAAMQGYPADWQSYHCALVDPLRPAIMDDFWVATGGPETCKHDQITVAFLTERVRAITSRP